AWPDPLGVGMHAVIPVLFVVAVEAARHAVGRIADITADKHMEGVRLTRWLLSPVPTFLLWRRMKLWELRSYEQVIKLEQDRLVYRARLQSVYGRAWRRKAPVESLMPLRLAKFGVPLAETAPAGLAAAGMEPVLLPSVSIERTDLPTAGRELDQEPDRTLAAGEAPASVPEHLVQQLAPSRVESEPMGEGRIQEREQAEDEQPTTHQSPWFTAQHVYEGTYDPAFTEADQLQPQPEQALETREPPASAPEHPFQPDAASPVETAPARERELPRQQVGYAEAVRAYAARVGYEPDPEQLGWFLAEAYGITDPVTGGPHSAAVLSPDLYAPDPDEQVPPFAPAEPPVAVPAPRPPGAGSRPDDGQKASNEAGLGGPPHSPEPEQPAAVGPEQVSGARDGKAAAEQTLTVVDRYFLAWEGYIAEHGQEPTAPQLSQHLASRGILNRNGSPVAPATLRRYLLEFRIYNVWAEQHEAQADPAVPAVLEELARRGVTGQYNRPLEAATVEDFLGNFRRRYQVFSLDVSSSTP
ncbi:DUF2637 domain-containing protein, partial [Streptomyces mauvecolor]